MAITRPAATIDQSTRNVRVIEDMRFDPNTQEETPGRDILLRPNASTLETVLAAASMRQPFICVTSGDGDGCLLSNESEEFLDGWLDRVVAAWDDDGKQQESAPSKHNAVRMTERARRLKA